jgi:two-component system, OmpR family, response regulator ChvI
LKKILVVDDEEDITDSLKIGLERFGFNVDTFNDPQEALKKFKPKAYDVILLDIRMPKMNGFEAYREFTRIDKDVRVCFLTAFEVYKEEFHRLLPEFEIQFFLRKPISISDLASKIKEITGESH